MGHDLFALGVVVAAALVIGRIVAGFGVPRVTGYLLAGTLLGPSFAKLVGIPSLLTHHTVDDLQPLAETALALIVFSVGKHFHFSVIRKWRSRVLALIAADIFVPFALVLLATSLTGAKSDVALMLAIIAATTSPAATVMVIRECEADGEISNIIGALLGFSNFLVVIAFQVVAHFVVTPQEPLSHLAYVVGLPLLVGGGVGAVVSYWEQRLDRVADRQLMGMAAIVVLAGSAHLLGLSVLLTSLVAGIVVANAAPHERQLFDDLHKIDYPYYVPFFVLAGAHLNLQMLPQIGLVGLAYLVARAAGKILGNSFGARLGKFSDSSRRWLGLGMVAQAGVAVGFASQLRRTWGQTGQHLEVLVLSSVLVFEVIGPVLTRQSLIRGGEVSVLTMLSRRAPVGVWEGIHHVVEQFRDSLGIPSWHKLDKPRDVFVTHLMRRNVETIRDSVSFRDVLHALGHSRYDRIPVLDDQGKFVGQVRYADVSSVLFDEALSTLIIARDLATPDDDLVLDDKSTLDDALSLFSAHPDVTYVPVLSGGDERRLAGILRQNDVLAACRKF